jgi:hypothetical protein
VRVTKRVCEVVEMEEDDGTMEAIKLREDGVSEVENTL